MFPLDYIVWGIFLLCNVLIQKAGVTFRSQFVNIQTNTKAKKFDFFIYLFLLQFVTTLWITMEKTAMWRNKETGIKKARKTINILPKMLTKHQYRPNFIYFLQQKVPKNHTIQSSGNMALDAILRFVCFFSATY